MKSAAGISWFLTGQEKNGGNHPVCRKNAMRKRSQRKAGIKISKADRSLLGSYQKVLNDMPKDEVSILRTVANTA